jgi:hypothetical protein
MDMQRDAAAAAQKLQELQRQLAAVAADTAALEAYCCSVAAYTQQLTEFECQAREQIPVMQQLLADPDALALHVLQGTSSSDAVLAHTTAAAADYGCSAGLSSHSALLLLFQGGSIGLQQ